MKRITIVFSLLFSMPRLFAQEYNIANIPDSLLQNVNAVVRYDEFRFEIKDIGKAKSYKKHVYTILNEAGDRYANYVSSYNKQLSIDNIDGTLYDAMGKQLKDVKKKDIADVSGNDDEALMVDTRYKQHNFYYRAYPYTVEYDEEDSYDGLYEIHDWNPHGANNISVQYSRYVITTPENLPIRYTSLNFDGKPVITQKNGTITYTWEIKNLPGKKAEPFQPSWSEIFPIVMVSPSKFEYGGYTGDMSTWKGFGQFGYELLKGRDVLPANIRDKVHEIVVPLHTTKEKIDTLYKFMQQNTRYISIQLGIGGLQPFDANFVAQKKYGDCKALSNYMVALLKEAGIPAYSAWIKSGDYNYSFLPDFPSDQFDHVIACVPLNKDTLWLECTSQTISPGYLGSFTDNRYALLLDESGGKLVKTKQYSKDDNKQVRVVRAELADNGTLTADLHSTYACLREDPYRYFANNSIQKDRIKEYLNEDFDLPDYSVENFSYKETKAEKPYINEDVKMTMNNYASVTGKRLFLMPDIITKSKSKLNTTEPRQFNIKLEDAYTTTDSVFIKIPSGYKVESLPKDIHLDTKYGKYDYQLQVQDSVVFLQRKYECEPGEYPPTDYADFAAFYNAIYKADHSKIVFIKPE